MEQHGPCERLLEQRLLEQRVVELGFLEQRLLEQRLLELSLLEQRLLEQRLLELRVLEQRFVELELPGGRRRGRRDRRLLGLLAQHRRSRRSAHRPRRRAEQSGLAHAAPHHESGYDSVARERV